MKKFLMIFPIIFLAILFLPSGNSAKAASNFLITWNASSYAPPDYQGKILPSPGSTITISFDLVSTVNDWPVNLSQQMVYWYLNDNLIQTGVGLQKISFTAPAGSAGGNLDVRIELPGYGDGTFLQTVSIPVSQPLAMIQSGLTSNNFSQSPLVLFAQPFFFNIFDTRQLNYFWTVNGQNASSSDNPSELDINMIPGTTSGFNVNVSLNIQNQNNTSEIGTNNLYLIYQ